MENNMKLAWKLETNDQGKVTIQSGGQELKAGENHLIIENVHGIVNSASASMKVPMENARLFMNGYQTWTYCPEYSKGDKIRGLQGVPSFLVRKYSFDRYGDYHFIRYPDRKNLFHGFSWCTFRKGTQARLFASLDEQPGYTIFRYDAETEMLTMERDCAGVRIDGAFQLLDLFFTEGEETAFYDAWFKAMNKPQLQNQKLYGYSSWYNRYQNIDEKGILQDLDGCAKILEPGDLFQIDDGWEPFVGDWLKPDAVKFPNGMKAAADAIHAKGYRAGLWLAPFAAEKNSALFKEHPDWFLKKDGEPWSFGSNWSGFYGLDIDNPEVLQYLKEVFHQVKDDWGFDLVKLDFLYAAAPFNTEKESRGTRMARAMDLLRELCGNMEILGCGVPVMPAFGKVEYCRVSCDVSLDRDDKFYMRAFHRERVSTLHAVRTSLNRHLLNGRAYQSDPDVFFLRTQNIKLKPQEKEDLATIDALLHGVFMTSDDPGSYTTEMIDQYKRLRHLTTAKVLSVDSREGITILYELDGKTCSFHTDLF